MHTSGQRASTKDSRHHSVNSGLIDSTDSFVPVVEEGNSQEWLTSSSLSLDRQYPPSNRTTDRTLSPQRYQYPGSVSRSLPEDVLRGMTINKLRFSSLDLSYGRKDQIQSLQESFQQCCYQQEAGQRELVLVSGVSGTGKTQLASTLKKTVLAQKGFFMQGKCDLQRRVEPYVAFSSVFQQLCRNLKGIFSPKEDSPSSSPLPLLEAGAQLRQELGMDQVQVLIQLIPELSQLFHVEVSEMAPVEPTKARNRFNFAFRRLFRALTVVIGPGLLVLDGTFPPYDMLALI